MERQATRAQRVGLEIAAVHTDGADRNLLIAMTVARSSTEHAKPRAKFRLTVLAVVLLVIFVKEVGLETAVVHMVGVALSLAIVVTVASQRLACVALAMVLRSGHRLLLLRVLYPLVLG